ncbi:MAG: polyphosphate kinase 1 [Rikenellaceae bacterium]|nr:polyphosphate kinase 1 [Rikenellaceae bacterium]
MSLTNNRELSWLLFNDRVLQEAQDEMVPLLQRLRFLGISSNNQDEFIKVRVANVIRAAKLRTRKPIIFTGGYTPAELLKRINKKTIEAQNIFDKAYSEILVKMERHGIVLLNENELNDDQIMFCREYYANTISPRLVPLILRKSSEIPFLPDGRIYLAVKMLSTKKSLIRYAVLQIPVSDNCPRFIVLPSPPDRTEVIIMDDIIRLMIDEIFFMFNYDEISVHTFKIMRDAELTLDDDVSKSLVEKIEQGLNKRKFGQPIRLTYDKNMPEDLLRMLSVKLGLKNYGHLIPGGRYHQMKHLMKFPRVNREFEEKIQEPVFHPDIRQFSSILSVLRKKDIFLNYPYHSFGHFIDFLHEAAIDPKIVNIFITLYRTAEHSKVINALINAAKNGKKVTVLVELKARFDEEQNIYSSEVLQNSGVKVLHSPDMLKVHSKVVLVERREGAGLRGYGYIGTGNFNESTAKIYSDYGLFTTHPGIINDIRKVMLFLTDMHNHFYYDYLLVAPHSMRYEFEKLINNEIKNAKKEKKAFIYAKFNRLTDEKIISLLYDASSAGVDIRLVIRGACCLKPQVKGLSDNIRIISIVDKYLEHARMAIFCNGGAAKYYILSADWMSRNLDRRVEVGTPILDRKIKKNLMDIFMIQWNDCVKARDLSSMDFNKYVKCTETNTWENSRSQTRIYDYYKTLTNG